ncbi:alpha-1,3-mannosyltransferase CMT1 [Metarhizium album ARSEF 1941]|uniref:Alpha-1,3-mannosyltransferase CMT1 n=1 Tax=Metarhizium album (strain ARSEF 1941) TaxID=1081103 RepID=A0A0B2X9Q8_METAS|nr:alpha-1,3-mannosyltransferase CMT1 [Metarhizium album ARSEF 1941]KHO02061.1 alpha-1,3-mannosyltransferase CMT1 [Metarhizium album ARSEF 1941]
MLRSAFLLPSWCRISCLGLIVFLLLAGLALIERDGGLFHGALGDSSTVSSGFLSKFRKQPGSPQANGIILSAADISSYRDAIFNTSSKTLDRLECPAINATRYQTLKQVASSSAKIEYVFPLNLRQNLPLLPTLLGSIVEAIRFLGPERCALSIVEGNSPDGTFEVLEAIRPDLERLGVSYFCRTTALNPSQDDRIEKLAALRNAALQPVLDIPDMLSPSSTVVFLNDVLACAEDILELALQLRLLGADMTCAMDWEITEPPRFYDVWIGRSILGDTFWDIPANMSWDKALDLFSNEPETAKRFGHHLPFQVFACWNGGVSFRMQPLLEGLRFRAPNFTAGECVQGEPQLFCAELWYRGHGKIAVVPAVNFGYSNGGYDYIKKNVGFVSDWVRDQSPTTSHINWVGPPDEVKCIEPWSKQFWQPWNAGLEARQ